MTLLDVGNCVVVSPLHDPAVYNVAGRDGYTVDTAKYAYAFVVIHLGNLHGSETVHFELQHALTSGGSFTACNKLGTTDDAQTAEYGNANDDQCKIISVDLNNTKRFLKLRANHSSSISHEYSACLVLMPYLTNTVSDDAKAASAPEFNV
jgi:hypothetical protein